MNRNLLSLFRGNTGRLPCTTIGDHYAVWEHDFEHAVQTKHLKYEGLKRKIAQQEDVTADSKPLIAYHFAVNSQLNDFPQDVQALLSGLVEKIRTVQCLPLTDLPAPTNVISLHAERIEGAIPVYASAAGRNTTAEDDTPVNYATGNFPSGTSCLVHIQGDSMANQIPDGCYVAVKHVQERPSPGSIAIFSLDGGEMVCKQYIERHTGEQMLKSLNPEYPPIILTEGTDCRVRGEVIMRGRKQPAVFFEE